MARLRLGNTITSKLRIKKERQSPSKLKVSSSSKQARRCCVCRQDIKKLRNTSGFTFPIKDRKRCKLWAKIIGVPVPENRNLVICERHFEARFITQGAKNRKFLLKTAVPSLQLKTELSSDDDSSDEESADSDDKDDEIVEQKPTVRAPPVPSKPKRGRQSAVVVKKEVDVQQQLLTMMKEKDRVIKALEVRVDGLENEIKLLQDKVKQCVKEPLVMPFKKRFVAYI